MTARLDFTVYDFDSLVAQLQDIVKTKDLWKDNYASGVGLQLIELYAYNTELMMYMIERRATEQYINLARLPSSVRNIVSLVGYVPDRAISAVGQVNFLSNGTHTYATIIPQFTRLKTAAGLYFLTTAPVSTPVGTFDLAVDVIQGQLAIATQVASGLANQTVQLSDVSPDGESLVENAYVLVTVDSVTWTKVTSFVSSLPTDLHYVVRNNIDGTVAILFGDGRYGKIPPVSKTITVQYVLTDGIDGNIYASNLVTTIVDPLYDTHGDLDTLISVWNPASILGGVDGESIESIRANAPSAVQNGGMAVTRNEHIAILEAYPNIGSAYAWGENDLTPPNEAMRNRIYISAIHPDWSLLDVSTQTALRTYLYDYAQLTVVYEFVDPEIIEVYATDVVKAASSASLTTVKAAVEAALDAAFVMGVSKLGTAISYANLVAAIAAVSGVMRHTLDLLVRKPFSEGDGSTLVFGGIVTPLELVAGTVKIYLDDVLQGHDNGAGVIVSDGGCTGTINTTDGTIALTFGSAPGIAAAIKIEYKLYPSAAQAYDLVPGPQQIFRLTSRTVTVSF